MHVPIGLRAAACVLGLVLLATVSPVRAQVPDTSATEPSEAEKAAMAEAASAVVDAWLEHVDADSFGTAYDAVGTPIRDRIRREGWIAAFDALREHVDAPAAREQTIAQYRATVKKIDGGPFISFLYEGEYELGTFSEMILTRRADDGSWSIVGYQVVPDMNLLREHEELSFEMIDYSIEADSTGEASGENR